MEPALRRLAPAFRCRWSGERWWEPAFRVWVPASRFLVEGGEWRVEANAESDGSVIAEYPLLDDDWAVRHVLQYGPEAVVVEPQRVREMVRERLLSVIQGPGRVLVCHLQY